MREIKNNVEIGKIQKQETKPSVAPSSSLPVEKTGPVLNAAESEKEIKDFSNPSGEVLGRSQVIVSKADNVKEDVKFGMAHPEAIERSDKLFNLALAKLEKEGDPNAYEKACAISTSADSRELLSK